MHLRITLDDALVEEAFRYADVRTPSDLVEVALREFVRNHGRKDVRDFRDLRGKIRFYPGYDCKALRRDREAR